MIFWAYGYSEAMWQHSVCTGLFLRGNNHRDNNSQNDLLPCRHRSTWSLLQSRNAHFCPELLQRYPTEDHHIRMWIYKFQKNIRRRSAQSVVPDKKAEDPASFVNHVLST